ncbi:type IV secretion system protein VirB5 [Pseudomonas duriflava]|uniref:Type IV secretion system protein VirB5 n=1 Tax=Pseudomonas duriflava TaxID=459528 RepID=A0A562PP10_9PSED|nr:VirB8/TrbF family protein [Pseudomonas duriflava]TWI46164.1 type IV secretion system protein VirB5 [Pseudomonas duriflava]
MSNWKRFFFKQQPQSTDPLDPRRGEPLVGGRRQGESENPYLAARRTWNDHVGSVVASRMAWQVMGLLCLMISLAAVGGLIYIGSQSKFIPYIVQTDKLGAAVAFGRADQTSTVDQRVIQARIASFIADARLVTPDISLQRAAVFRVYAVLSSNDAATKKMNEWLNGTPESRPFTRAETETVSVEIKSVLQQTPETYQVDWEETTRDRSGSLKKAPELWRAMVTVYQAETNPAVSEQELMMNPIRLFVRDFSWSKPL